MSRNTLNTTETRREDWETPKWLFHFLNEVAGFNFAMDIAATKENALCPAWIGQEQDASSMTRQEFIEAGTKAGVDLENRWSWCNPPYAKSGLPKWSTTLTRFVPNVVALVPGSVGTKWFRPLWATASTVVLIAKRLKFGNSEQGAQFDSALYVRGNILTLAQMEQLRVLGTVIKANAVSQWRGDGPWVNAENMLQELTNLEARQFIHYHVIHGDNDMSRTRVKKPKPNKRKLARMQREAYAQQLRRRQAMMQIMDRASQEHPASNKPEQSENADTSGTDHRD